MAMKAPEVSKRTPIGRGPPSGSIATSASYKCRGSPGRPKTYGTPSAFMARTTASHPVKVGINIPPASSVLPDTPRSWGSSALALPLRLRSRRRPHQRRVWQRFGGLLLASAPHGQAESCREQTEQPAPDKGQVITAGRRADHPGHGGGDRGADLM